MTKSAGNWLYLALSYLHWNFSWLKYLADTHINTRNGYKKWKCDQRTYVSDRDSMARVKAQTHGQVIETLDRNIAFPLRLQRYGRVIEKLSWVFERIGHVFWNKYPLRSFGQRETLGIFENLVWKKQPTYIELKYWNLSMGFTFLIFIPKLAIDSKCRSFFSFYISIIESKFRCFTQVSNATIWYVTVLVFQEIASTVIGKMWSVKLEWPQEEWTRSELQYCRLRCSYVIL